MKRIIVRILAILLLCLCFNNIFGQIIDRIKIDTKITKVENKFNKSEVQTADFVGFVDMKNIRSNWKRRFYNLEKEHDVPNKEKFEQIKAEKNAIKFNIPRNNNEEKINYSPKSVIPTIGVNFLGNEMFGGTPPDNTVAISNGGKIVSVDNSTIEIYNDAGSYLSVNVEHYDFFGNTSLTGTIYDPRVIYDVISDRFIFVILHGSTSSTSKILVSFSKTNNPQDGWWVYTLNGNSSHSNCWFDFPSIGISNNELYISGNMFSDADIYQGNVLFQIPKQAGYNGGSLNYQYWTDVKDGNNNTGFTLVPISKGQSGSYGPGTYLVSSYSGGGNQIQLYNLTDDMSSASEQINSYAISTNTYSASGDAAQLGSGDLLDNGDCRIQNGFYLNGYIHFVFHSDIGNGWNGINYNRLNLSNSTNSSTTFGLSGSYDYSYPQVASFTNSSSDKSVMIGFLRSSSAMYPEIRVVNCDNSSTWSNSVLVKQGASYINIVNGNERWGDYTGISRKHNASTPEVWMSGCYGVASNSNGASHGFNAWIAEIGGTVSIGNDKEVKDNVSLYPNPVIDMFSIELNLSESQKINISIFNIEGKLIRVLYDDKAKKGKSILRFNKNALSEGIYNISVKNEYGVIKNEKIIVVK